jgi:hypothetical protein
MITVIFIFIGLMVCGGLVLRHQLRIAPLVKNNKTPRRNPHRFAFVGLPRKLPIDPARVGRSNAPETRRLMKRLQREEARQRPQEARN